MKDINKKIVFFTAIAVLLIGTITFLLIYRNNKNNEPLIGIDNVSFTLNNIKENFLASQYSKEHSCYGFVYENGIQLTCDKINYDFTFDGVELFLDSDDPKSQDVFKYVVNEIEKLHGYEGDEYIETIDKIFLGEFVANGLSFTRNDEKYTYSVDLTRKLEEYKNLEIVNDTTIKNIGDTSYEFNLLGYKISNVEVIKSDIIRSLICTGTVSESNNYNVNLTINYYDDSNNLITSQTVNLNEFETFGNPYLGFAMTLEIADQATYDLITKYSISLS